MDEGGIVPSKEEQSKAMKEKSEKFQEEINKVCSKYNASMLAGVRFKKESMHGVFKFGDLIRIEELGLCKAIEQTV